jgi:hypothetical protein
MTCLTHTNKPAALQIHPSIRGGATHQHAALLALHFRSASWTPCISGPTLLAARIIVDSVDFPQAQWDIWFFRSGSVSGAARLDGNRTSIRRARLRAAASVVVDDESSWMAVLEERVVPACGKRGRRLVAPLSINPYTIDAHVAPVDPRAAEAVYAMSARDAASANPQPDLTVDLEALGLVAPRPQSW